MNQVTVGSNAKIIKGVLKGKSGVVVAYEYHIDEVWISLDKDTTVLVESEMIEQ